MVEQTFSINNAWGVKPPCYVLKVDRRGHWKDADTIQDKVFRVEPDNAISVYTVATATDLARVAIALNANRSSMIEPLFLVAITSDDLAGIDILQTTGATLCKWANRLHRDLKVTDVSQIARLSQALVSARRETHKFTKSNMREALDATAKDGCHAAKPDSVRCVCEIVHLPRRGRSSGTGLLPSA